jgi:hypothetical protein
MHSVTRMKDALLRRARLRFASALAATCGACLLGWLTLGLRSCSAPPDTRTTQAHPVAERAAHPTAERVAPATAGSAAAPRQLSAVAQTSSEPGVALSQALSSDDVTARIQALRQVRDETQVQLLPNLLAFDLSSDPELAPTLIGSVASLARASEPQQRSSAAQRLGDWLRSESQREGADARGNMAMLVEALAQLDSHDASSALIEALEHDRLPVHMATLAVQGLARSGDPAALGALQQFRDRLTQAPASTGFEHELHDEATQATEQALARLAR